MAIAGQYLPAKPRYDRPLDMAMVKHHHQKQQPPQRASPHASPTIDPAGGPGGGALSAERAAMAASSIASCPPLGSVWRGLLHAMEAQDALRCPEEVRLTFGFTPTGVDAPAERRASRITLPVVDSSPCNIVLSDERTQFRNEKNWTVRRLSDWPWPSDLYRSTHVAKVLAPLLFPNSRSVLFGDVKCITRTGQMPCAAFLTPAHVTGVEATFTALANALHAV